MEFLRVSLPLRPQSPPGLRGARAVGGMRVAEREGGVVVSLVCFAILWRVGGRNMKGMGEGKERGTPTEYEFFRGR